MPKTELITRAGKGPTAKATVTDAGLVVIENACAEGQDLRSVSKLLGMDGSRLRHIRDRDQRVEDAIANGYAALRDELTHLLLTQARNGNTTAAIFLAKARLGWSDRGDTPIDGPRVVNNTQVVINLPSPKSRREYMRTIAGTVALAKDAS